MEVFEATEGIFDKVTILVTPLIIADRALAVCAAGNNGELGGLATPAAAHLQNMDDARDSPTIIDPAGTSLVVRQK